MAEDKTTLSTLKIPFALDEESVLSGPHDSIKGKSYFCPACGEPVILRKGPVKVAHFAHKPNNICTQETVIHKTAKCLIRDRVRLWKQGKAHSPRIIRRCQICAKPVEQTLPPKTQDATIEFRMPNGYVVDIALIGEANTVLAAVEVRVTHEVGEQKSGELGIPFIEVDGNRILEDPSIWAPLRDQFRSLTCSNCKQAWSEFEMTVQRISNESRIELPSQYYRYAPTCCWKCKREILVFSWPDHNQFPQTPPRKQPVPRTVQYCYSATVGDKYWVNTCPYCKSIQGDFFLYSEPDEPFFGFHCGPDDPESFQDDLSKLAAWTTYRGYFSRR